MDERVEHDGDEQLVRAVLVEEAAAIDALVTRLRCIPRILSVLNQRVGGVFQPDDLDDLTQDTLTAFWSRLGDYSGQSALETWAYGFCVNGFMSALRRKRTRGGARRGGSGIWKLGHACRRLPPWFCKQQNSAKAATSRPARPRPAASGRS